MRDIDIDEIIITSDYRKHHEDLGGLALSIRNTGLIHPIRLRKVGDKFEIDAGRQRFRALTELLKIKTLKHIEHFLLVNKEVDPLLIQFAENVHRTDFRPLEQAKLVYDIHSKNVADHGPAVRGRTGGWGAKETAKLMNLAPSTISQYIRLWMNRDVFTEEEQEDMDSINDALAELRKRRSGSMLRQVRQEIVTKVRANLPAHAQDLLVENLQNFKHTQAQEYIKTLHNITHIITDPPYAVNLDQSNIGTHEYECYEDNEKKYIDLMQEMIPQFSKLLTNGYLIIWCSFEKFGWLKDLCEKNKFSCSKVPIIWKKTNTGGDGPNVQKLLPVVTECALYGWKGDVEIMEPGRSNHLSYPIPKAGRIHVAQKDESLQKALLRIFTAEGDRIADFFAGSGSMLRACTELNRVCFSCEEDIHNYNSAISLCAEMFDEKPKEEEEESKFKGLYDTKRRKEDEGEEDSELDDIECTDE